MTSTETPVQSSNAWIRASHVPIVNPAAFRVPRPMTILLSPAPGPKPSGAPQFPIIRYVSGPGTGFVNVRVYLPMSVLTTDAILKEEYTGQSFGGPENGPPLK